MAGIASGGLLATPAVAQTAPTSFDTGIGWTTEVRLVDEGQSGTWTGSPGCGTGTEPLTWTTSVTPGRTSGDCETADRLGQVRRPFAVTRETVASEWESGTFFTPAPGQSLLPSGDSTASTGTGAPIAPGTSDGFTTDPDEVDGGFLDLSYGLDDIQDRQGVGGAADLMDGFSEMGDDAGVGTRFTPRIRGQLNFSYGQNPVDGEDVGEMLIAPGLAWGDRDRTEFRFMLPIEVTGERTDVGVMTGARRKF